MILVGAVKLFVCQIVVVVLGRRNECVLCVQLSLWIGRGHDTSEVRLQQK